MTPLKLLLFTHKEFSGEELAICPFCKSIGEQSVQSEDYVSNPMLWCDDCGARSIIDPNYLTIDPDCDFLQFKKLSFSKEEKEDADKLELELTNVHKENLDDYVMIQVPLAFINKVVNNDLMGFRSTENLSDDKIRQFIISNYSLTVAKRLKIFRAVDNTGRNSSKNAYPDWKGQTIPVENIVNISVADMKNIGVICESYNAENPIVKYPENFSLDHAGINVAALCTDINGKEFVCTYSGD